MTNRVLHVISGLNTGGAELMLYKLLSHSRREVVASEVLSLTSIGPVGMKIRSLGIPVKASGFCRGEPNPFIISHVAKVIRTLKPSVVQSWMYHADLVAGIASRLAGRIPVAWGVRHGRPDPSTDKRWTMMTIKACSLLSRFLPSCIVFNSREAQAIHTKLGYSSEKSLIIPNGFDLNVYRPDEEARFSVRRQLGVPLDTELIGCIARFDPTKDHRTLIQAAARVIPQRPRVRFVLAGPDVTWENATLASWIRTEGLENFFSLLGAREDIPRLTAAMDLVTLSSITEGFPNVIGEAMATGIACVVTDAGDAAQLVGDTGRVVPPREPAALASALLDFLAKDCGERRRLGQSARERIRRDFSIQTVSEKYERLYLQLAYA
jgi:glycosyltransferase involved in cell wall biosynthesis